MTFSGLSRFNTSTCGYLKALFCAGFGLHLGHFVLLIEYFDKHGSPDWPSLFKYPSILSYLSERKAFRSIRNVQEF